ncbi:MAG: hypothetical protein KatS3mg040_0118 [Candidatus Kapaibacterium sp.]|nr:MAG: hypothetical protein KatS3mg040_0118 [Candidatus Kapabacteria bacterium]
MEKVAAKPFGSAEHITAAYAPTGAGFEDAQRVIPTHTGHGQVSSVEKAGSARYEELTLPARSSVRGGTNGVVGNPSDGPQQYSSIGNIERLLSVWYMLPRLGR